MVSSIASTKRAGIAAITLLATAGAGPAAGEDILHIEADSPTVELSIREPGRSSIRLPALEYRFTITVRCAADRPPALLSLNVADTRRSLTSDQIDASTATEVNLRVPAGQIAPLVIENFCVTAEAESAPAADAARRTLTIPAALSAQASLLCGSETGQVMTYASRPLDVALVCNPPDDTPADEGGRTLID